MFGLVSTLLLLSFVVAPEPDPKFSHDLANNMLQLAAAAYSDDPGVCIRNHFKKGEVVRFYKVDCRGPLAFSLPVSCAAYTAVIPSRNAIVLSFRGTDGGFIQLLKEGAHSGLSKDWFGKAQVNTYFLSAFRNLWTIDSAGRMLKDAMSLIRNTTYKDYKIWITGHSLGGAMASLAASYLLETNAALKNRIYLVTFGQPRTGDKVFADNLNLKIHYAFRVINSNDMVPHIPSYSGTFWKVKYIHHKKEVFYFHPSMENGGFSECPNEDEPNYELLAFCSGHYVSKDLDWPTFKSHRCYYKKYVSMWGIEGCVATEKYLAKAKDVCK